MLKGHFLRVKLPVMCRVRGLMAEQIPVRPGVKEPLVALVFHLAQGQRDRAVREFLPDHGDDLRDLIFGHKRIFPALKDESPKS